MSGAAAAPPRVPKPREPLAQLAHTLGLFRVEAVLDVGANEGQYAASLRAQGWAGPIVSVEPIPEVRERLAARAAGDPAWAVLPAMALGERDGEAALEISAESDMSSLLAQGPLLRRVSPSSAVARRVTVPLRRLDGLALPPPAATARRLFLKLDVQGAEPRVLEGAAGLMPRIVGLQVEMALVPLYEGESLWRDTVALLEAAGFDLHLLLPGYYERRLGRQLQVDGVFYRRDAAPPL